MYRLHVLLFALSGHAAATCPANSFSPVEATDAETTGRLFYSNDEAILSGTGAVIGVTYKLEEYSFDAVGGSSIATIASSSVAYIIGPAMDLKNKVIYYIRGASADSYELVKYGWTAQTTTVVYTANAASFPAAGGRTSAWQMALDVNAQRVWWYMESRHSSVVFELWSLDLATPQNGATLRLSMDEMPALGTGSIVTDWFALQVDCNGVLYMAFYKKIVKWDPNAGASAYSDVLARSAVEDARCVGGHKVPYEGHSCMIHSLVVDDHSPDAGANGRLLFAYWQDNGVYNVRSIDKTGGSDTILVESIYYEEPACVATSLSLSSRWSTALQCSPSRRSHTHIHAHTRTHARTHALTLRLALQLRSIHCNACTRPVLARALCLELFEEQWWADDRPRFVAEPRRESGGVARCQRVWSLSDAAVSRHWRAHSRRELRSGAVRERSERWRNESQLQGWMAHALPCRGRTPARARTDPLLGVADARVAAVPCVHAPDSGRR